MKKLTFERYGLSPEKVEQLRAHKILPDERTLKSLVKAYETDKAEETEIADFQRELNQLIDEEYIRFLLEHSGGIPSKNRAKGSRVVIDRFLVFRSAYKLYLPIDLYTDPQEQGAPIVHTPTGDTLLLAEDQQIYLFNYNMQDTRPFPITTPFANLLVKLYQFATIDYTPKEYGRATVTINNGTIEIAFVTSHLHDSRQDLIHSVTTLEKYREAIVVSQGEPGGYILHLEHDNKHCYYTLHSFKGYDSAALYGLVLEENISLASYKNDIVKIK